jgi:hypothetical protein
MPPGQRGLTSHFLGDFPCRRHGLLVGVTHADSEVSRLIHEGRHLNLPVEPGVRAGRDTLTAGPRFQRSCCPEPAQQPAPAPQQPLQP